MTRRGGTLTLFRFTIIALLLGQTVFAQSSPRLTQVKDRHFSYPVDVAYYLAASTPDLYPALIDVASTYATLGDTATFFAIIDELESKKVPNAQLRTLPRAVVAMAKSGRVNLALTILEKAQHRPAILSAAENLMLYLIKEERMAGAAKALAFIDQPLRKSRAQVMLVKGFSAIGQYGNALNIIKNIKDSKSIDQAHFHLAEALASAGQLDRANRYVIAIKSPRIQEEALFSLFKAHLNKGDVKGARQIAQLIRSPDIRIPASVLLVGALAARGQDNAALDLQESLPFQQGYWEAATEIARAWIDLGDIERVEILIDKMPQGAQRDAALFYMAKVFAKNGAYDNAMLALDLVSNDAKYQDYFIDVARIFGESRQFYYPLLLVKQSKPEGLRFKSLSAYLLVFARHGSFKKVVKIADEISDPAHRDATLAKLPDIFLAQDKGQSAVDIVGKMSDIERRIDTYIALGETLFHKGYSDLLDTVTRACLRDIRNLSDRSRRCAKTGDLATLLLDTGNLSQAKEIIGNCVKQLPRRQLSRIDQQSLARYALIYVKGGDPVGGLRIIAEVQDRRWQLETLLTLPQARPTSKLLDKNSRRLFDRIAR